MTLLACGGRSGNNGDPEAFGGLGDGALASYPWEPGAASGNTRMPRSCAEDWAILYETDASMPGSLAVHDSELIFGVDATTGRFGEVRAVDIAGSGRERKVRSGASYEELWLDGDDLLLWGRARLRRMPLPSGRDELLLDLSDDDASRAVASLLVQSDAVYWTRVSDGAASLELWRQARTGEPRELIASLDPGLLPRQLAANAERLIVAGSPGAVALSLEDGSVRALDVVPEGVFAGVDDDAAYYERVANRTRQGGSALEFEIRRAAADGSPSTQLWHGAAGERLQQLWPVESGWLATGAWYLFDGAPHSVIAHLDAEGDVTLIACDRGRNALLGRPVYADGAFYAVTRSGNRRRIVEIELPDE